MSQHCYMKVGRRVGVAGLRVFIVAGLILVGRHAGGAEVILVNTLATATSPYLREAATQPVAWLPWGEEPFRLARELDRPILLDIGAIWCHWCHVMDVETYGNPEVADLINTHFIAIKVDWDERPDIDVRYQKAVQVLTGSGGWPLTVFMSPEGKVFHGDGTFFPDDRFGRPGFKTLLPKVAAVYHQRKEAVLAAAEQLHDALAAIVLDQLAALTNEPRYQQRAERLLEAFAGRTPEFGRSVAAYALAVDLHLHPSAHAVIIGPQRDARTQALWGAALGAFRPRKLVAVYDPALAKPTDLPQPVAAAMQAVQTTGTGPTAYVCVGTTCSLPTSEPAAVASLVTTFQQRGPQGPSQDK